MRDITTSAKFTNQFKGAVKSHLNSDSLASLSVQHVSWSVSGSKQTILHPISFDLAPGRVLGVVGPNGAVTSP